MQVSAFFRVALLLCLLILASANRVVVYADTSRAGLSDRRGLLTRMLELSNLLRTTLVFPRPCVSLSVDHQATNQRTVDCSVGWDHFLHSSHDFVGYTSNTSEPACESPLELQDLLVADSMSLVQLVLRDKFCLRVSKQVWDYIDVFDAFFAQAKRTLSAALGATTTPPVFLDLSQRVRHLARKQKMKLNLSAFEYGAVKVRRFDKPDFYTCTEPQHVVEAVRSVVSAAAPQQRNMTWLVFAHVYEEEGYWAKLRRALAESELVQTGLVGAFVLEPDMEVLTEQTDNYLVYSVLQLLMWQARLSVGTSPADAGRVHLCNGGVSVGKRG